MPRLALYLLAAIVGLHPMGANSAADAAAPASGKVNILFILADDLGYSDLSCYGSLDIQTPHLDQLAREGVRLKQCYASSAVCSPTRVAFLTGNHPRRQGFEWVVLPGEKTGLTGTDRSLAALLRKNGYATSHFGKWHLGYTDTCSPRSHGFDQSFGILSSDADYFTYRNSVGEPDLFENGKPARAEGYLTDVLAAKAIEFMTTNQANAKPFFMYLAFTAPHWPFQRPGKPYDSNENHTYGPEHGTRADYVTMVERMDHQIGRILDTLAALKLADRTLVIFTSDNGGERLSDNGPMRQGKYTLWEGGVRVPGIVRWPGKIAPSSESRQCAITPDWTVSILNAADVSLPPEWRFDGENILPILQGQTPQRDRTFYWALPQQRAIRKNNWKLLRGRVRGAAELADFLFDLDVDSGELRNLAARRPEIVKDLKDSLAAWESQMPKVREVVN